jgi:hypothetical protein
MGQEHKGSCMCGSVRFSFTGNPKFVADCVCESCRIAHGASAVCWVGVKTEQFALDAGEASLKWYPSSEESQRGFCVDCGTRLFFRSTKWPGEMHMAVACMDTPHDLVSTVVSFLEELPAWTMMSVRRKSQGPQGDGKTD